MLSDSGQDHCRVGPNGDLDPSSSPGALMVDRHLDLGWKGPRRGADRTSGDRRVWHVRARGQPPTGREAIAQRHLCGDEERLDSTVVRVAPWRDVVHPEELRIHHRKHLASPPRATDQR